MSVVNVNHSFVSLKPDGADASKIRASNWNDELLFTGGALGDLLYRDTGSVTGASSLTDVAVGSVLVSGGVGAPPVWSVNPTLSKVTLSTNGTAGAPNPAYAGDLTTGWFLSGVGDFRLSTGTNERIIVTGSAVYMNHQFLFNADNTYDIGGIGGNDPRNVGVAGYLHFREIADPAAGSTNSARLYVKDNGSGKSRLVVRFPTGAIQTLATEP